MHPKSFVSNFWGAVQFAVSFSISLLPCLGTDVLPPVFGFTQMSCLAPCRLIKHPALIKILINSECFMM